MAKTRATWTPEQARAWQRKATLANQLAAKARQERKRLEARAILNRPATAAGLVSGPDFANLTLARVRALVDRLLSRLAEQTDRKRIDGLRVNQLAQALDRLAEVERRLAGRPMPGSLKPTADRSRPAPPPVPRPSLPPEPPPARTLAEPPDW